MIRKECGRYRRSSGSKVFISESLSIASYKQEMRKSLPMKIISLKRQKH